MKLSKHAVGRVAEDFADADLGDERRTARLMTLAEGVAGAPQESLPRALMTEAEIEAGYRFLSNDAYDFDDILFGHTEATAQRARQARDVLVVHDTTDCSFKHLSAKEVGYLQTGKAGFYLHVALVVDRAHHRRPLGVIYGEPYWRTRRTRRGTAQRKVSGKETAGWKDREFLRWNRGVRYSAEQLEGVSAVHVMDREGDCYALLSEMVEGGHRFVVRSRVDRKVVEPEGSISGALACCEGLFEREVQLSRRAASTAPTRSKRLPARPTRTARLRFSATKVTLPRSRSADGSCPETIELNVVHVEEVAPPNGQEPVHWTLLTTEPVDTAEQVAAVVDAYRMRWLIEEYFKALKTGCSYEKRQLETRHALLNLLAVSMPIAVELLRMRALVMDDPNAPASDIVTELQLQILRKLGHRPLDAHPSAAQALFAIAGLGGHLRSNGPPGWLVLKRGYEKLLAYQVGWAAALQHQDQKL